MTSKALRLLLAWGPAVAWAAFIFYLSARVWDDVPTLFQINDKVAHVFLYGALGAALAWGAHRVQSRGAQRLRGKRWHGLVLALGLLYALSDEWHQSFVPMRTPSAGDFAADALGILLGYLAVTWLLRRRRRAIS